MRLTLRTLLAYLDDTLEPSEIKQIGQKVAESDAAQELIARLKQVTRRRRLTTPPDTAKGEPFDPNTVAAYLDNELPSEQVAELEKICLESDVHLAEVAACHQILTLVLGEPALVPPTAKERMYGLVKGREAIAFRKAPTRDAGAVHEAEDDDAMQSVLAFHRSQQSGWKRWVLPAAAVVLFLALPVVLIAVLMQGSSTPHNSPVAVNTDKKGPEKDKDGDGVKDKAVAGDGVKDKADKDATGADKDKTPASDKDKTPNPDKDTVPTRDKPADGGPIVERPGEPSKERREVAIYQGPAKQGAPSILVHRQRDDKTWKRLSPNTPVYTTDELVSLPGYASEIKTDSGIRLQLWGTLPQFTPMAITPLYESAVTLHVNSKIDLELTLERGRVYLANVKDKGPARVRLRFEKEVWDITLTEPDSEVVAELGTREPARNFDWKLDEPESVVKFCVLAGKAGLRREYTDFPSLHFPGPAFFHWDNRGAGFQGPAGVTEAVPDFVKEIAATKENGDRRDALDAISKRMGEKKPVNVALKEIMDDGVPLQRELAIFDLGSIDAIPAVLDVLDNKDEARAHDRFVAILTLYRWISRGLDYTKQLFDINTRNSGILLDKKYTPNEAAIVLSLLHDFNEGERRRAETFDLLADYLTNNKMAVRELAYMHLRGLSGGLKALPPYNAAWDLDKRGQSAELFHKMVKMGELPPAAPPPPAPMPPPMPPGGPSK